MTIPKAIPLAAAVLAAAGCSPRMVPVKGRVTVGPADTPLAKGMVVFESADGRHTARGPIGPDGRYELSTVKTGDGVFPGQYRVLVNPLDMSDAPDEQKVLPFDYKHMRFDTSGLEASVGPADNDIPLKLDPPRRKAK